MKRFFSISSSNKKEFQNCLVGNFLGRNFGDDLMLLGFLEKEALQHSNSRQIVLCQSLNTQTEMRVDAELQTFSLKHLFRAILVSQRIVLVGGSHFTVNGRKFIAAHKSLSKWAVVFLLSRLGGCEIQLKAIGVEIGSRQLLLRFLTKLILMTVEEATFRDLKSLNLASSLAPNHASKFHFEEDLAISTIQSFMQSHKSKAQTPTLKPDEFILVLAPAYHHFNYEWWRKELVSIKWQSEFDSLKVIMLNSATQNSGSDADILPRLKTLISPSNNISLESHHYGASPNFFLEIINEANCVITSRYHVGLSAKIMGKKVIVDAHHPKMGIISDY